MNSENTHPPKRDPYAPLRFRGFRYIFFGQIISSFGDQMLSFAIGWELWLRTHSAFALGMVGLVQIIPILLFSLPAGHIADRYERKRIIFLSESLLIGCTLGLAWLSFTQGPIALIYLCLFGIGVSQAFTVPAASTLVPQTVPAHLFTIAQTWRSSAWQLAAILGPAVGGLIVASTNAVTSIYVFDAFAALTFVTLLALVQGRPVAQSTKANTWESLGEGLRFIRTTKEILAAITLDMFAVLLGGSVTLLPVFATDILKVGPTGLGLMRAAPSVGAILMAMLLANLPPFKQAGRTLMLAVIGFGAATIVFGLSRSFWLSMLMLFTMGALDNISVVIRSTLMLVRTPEEMLGRASSVNNIFIGASNQLGGFESGVTAAWFGPVASVVVGGIGTILVVLTIGKIWPELSGMKTLDKPEILETAAAVPAD